MRSYVVALCALPFASCSSLIPPAPQSPAQAVFELKTAEGVALAIAVAYRKLPPCATGGPALCSNNSLLIKIVGDDNVAAKAIDSAETASRVLGYPVSTTQTLVDAATTAMTALTTLTQSLRLK